jgi:hypothetical protein
MDQEERLRQHHSLLLSKLETGDYFEYVAALSGFDNINHPDKVSFFICDVSAVVFGVFLFFTKCPHSLLRCPVQLSSFACHYRATSKS